jgi:hypothetical protein
MKAFVFRKTKHSKLGTVYYLDVFFFGIIFTFLIFCLLVFIFAGELFNKEKEEQMKGLNGKIIKITHKYNLPEAIIDPTIARYNGLIYPHKLDSLEFTKTIEVIDDWHLHVKLNKKKIYVYSKNFNLYIVIPCVFKDEIPKSRFLNKNILEENGDLHVELGYKKYFFYQKYFKSLFLYFVVSLLIGMVSWFFLSFRFDMILRNQKYQYITGLKISDFKKDDFVTIYKTDEYKRIKRSKKGVEVTYFVKHFPGCLAVNMK